MDTPPSHAPRPAQHHSERGVGPSKGPVAEVRPLDVTGLRTVMVGTALFLVAAIVLLVFRDWLQDTGREWWLWTCVAGFGLGVFGYDYCRRRARHHTGDQPR
jgi:hypothetical protein